MQHFAKALQHLDEATMLALGEIGIDDVVVQEIRARARRHSQQLVARAMNENSSQCADLGGDVDWHTGKYQTKGKCRNCN